MSLLSDLNAIIEPLGIPIETGVFSGIAPPEYIVLVPISDSYDLHADNDPGVDVQEVRISLFTQDNYSQMRRKVLAALLEADITITGRQYIGYETETEYHHYNIDVANYYEMEE